MLSQAWISSKEFGLTETSDTKLNLGCLVLHSLLENWPQAAQGGAKNGQYNGEENGGDHSYSTNSSENSLKSPNAGNSLRMPGHTPVIFNEGGTRPVLRITIEDAKKELEDSLLQESVPDWVKVTTRFRWLDRFCYHHSFFRFLFRTL